MFKFCTKTGIFIHPKTQTQSFIPFSVRPEQKILESSLVSILHGCIHINQAKEVHAHIVRKGLDQCCYVLTKLLRTLTKLDVPMDPYPRLVFQQVKYPDPFLWTALIRGYAFQGPFMKSVLLYKNMRRRGTGPVSFTFAALFKACSAARDVNLGTQVHTQTILVGGFGSDLYVGSSLTDMYAKCGCLDCGRRVFDEMLDRDVISWTSLIVAYAKSGNMEAASELFDGLPTKDMVAWTAMVTGYAQNARPREAVETFERMQAAGVKTDEFTLVGVISACAQLGAATYANWVRGVAEQSGFGPNSNVFVGSALIYMYAKCGSIEDAYQVFQKMEEKNVYSYSSMIVGFAMRGLADAALELFNEMVKTKTKPNRVTFIGLLTACSHGGMVELGKRLFAMMEEHYGVAPADDHYACMVDLLGRAGQLEEALKLVTLMPMNPSGAVWRALLGSSCIHWNPDIAWISASYLFELEPNNIGNYILLYNTYASAGMWDNVSKIRKLLRAKRLKTSPGWQLGGSFMSSLQVICPIQRPG